MVYESADNVSSRTAETVVVESHTLCLVEKCCASTFGLSDSLMLLDIWLDIRQHFNKVCRHASDAVFFWKL